MKNDHTDKRLMNTRLITIIALNISLALISFLKDTLLASYLGTSGSADTLFATFFLPDAIGFNILGQTAALVLVPVFVAQLTRDKKKEALGTAYLTSFVFLVLSLIITLLILEGNSFTIAQIISGGNNINKDLSLTLIKVLIPIMYIVPVAYIVIAYLNAQDKFIATTSAPLIYNAIILLTVIACMLFHVPGDLGILLISGAISIAALGMAVYLFLMAGAFRKRPSMRSCVAESLHNSKQLRKLSNQAICFVIIYTLYQSVLFIERYVASRVSLGGISALNYSYRLAQFPVWVFISALLVVILPEFSRHMAIQNQKELYNKLHNAWLTLFAFITPVAILLLTFRTEVLSIVFLRGAFSKDSLTLTSQIFAGYSISIICQSLSYLLLRVYLVNRKMEKVLLIYLISSAVNIAFDLCSYQKLGLWSIGIGAILGWFVNMLLLFLMGEADMRRTLLTQEPRTPVIIIGANLLGLSLAVLMKYWMTSLLLLTGSTLNQLITVIVCGLLYLALYLLILVKTKVVHEILK